MSSFGGNYVSLFEKVSGRFVLRFGTEGDGEGQFNHPDGVALDGNHFYVSDGDNDRVQMRTKAGVFIRVIGSGQGSGPGQIMILVAWR